MNIVSLLVLLGWLSLCHSYPPVFFMHGLDGTPNDWSSVLGWLKVAHPGQVATALPVDSGGDSHKPMAEMVQDIIGNITAIIKSNPTIYVDGFHLVGHSQGGLLTRAVLMESGFQIINYVSCAGPQYGVYGNYDNLPPAVITDYLYTRKEQDSYGVSNYWHDPISDSRYTSNAVWLATLNNETYNPNSAEWKRNFLSANKTVFNISPQDGTIVPWVSSVFGFWNTSVSGFINMEDQKIFLSDNFGLQTAYKSGQLVTNIVPNVLHEDWLREQSIFESYILPYLG